MDCLRVAEETITDQSRDKDLTIEEKMKGNVQFIRPHHPLLSIEYILPIVASILLEYVSLVCNVSANFFLIHKCISILYLPKCIEDLSNYFEHTKLLKIMDCVEH